MIALPRSARRSYTIAFAPRSGSNEICHLLSRNGLGNPSEMFQAIPQLRNKSAAADRIFSIIEEHTKNGIFGSKMTHDHRACVDAALRRCVIGYKTLDDLLPDHRWIWLRRRDKIAQAVSLSRAEQSGAWTSSSSLSGPSPDRVEPMFDYHHVLSRLMMLHVCDLAWQIYFDTNAIEPYLLTYEEFFSDLPTSVSDMVRYLGAGLCEHLSIDATPTLTMQRDETSTEWEERFKWYLSRIGDFDTAQGLGLAHVGWERFFFGSGWRIAAPRSDAA